ILAAVFLAGCKSDFLDRPAQGQYSEGTYPFAEGTGAFDPAIFEAYDALRLYGVHSAGFQAATSIRSDDADKGSTPSDGANTRQFDDFTLTSTNGLINGMWLDHYTAINRANIVLQRIA